MAKLEKPIQEVPVHRTFNGTKYHWIGTIHKTRREAEKAAEAYARMYGAWRRVVRLPQGYAVYARLYPMSGGKP